MTKDERRKTQVVMPSSFVFRLSLAYGNSAARNVILLI